jgi:hypothetical protein
MAMSSGASAAPGLLFPTDRLFLRRGAAAMPWRRGATRRFAERLDADVAVAVVRPAHGGSETLRNPLRDLKLRVAVEDPDRADLVLGDVAAAADEGDQPFRIGVGLAPDPQAEPDGRLRGAARRMKAAAISSALRRSRSVRAAAASSSAGGSLQTGSAWSRA